MILLKRPIRQWTNGAPRRIMHKYRLYNWTAQSYCMATYKGTPRMHAWDREPQWYCSIMTLRGMLHDGWIIVRPPLGLPAGV